MSSIDVLEYAVGEVKKDVDKMRVNIQEIIQQLGKLEGLTAANELREDLREQRDINLKQERELGGISKAIEQLKEAMLHSEDKSLRDAAQGITINFGDGADIGALQTGKNAASKHQKPGGA